MATDLPTHIRSFDPKVGRAIDIAADRWGVSRGAVKDWVYGRRLPRPSKAREMLELEKGKLSMASIYGRAP